MYSILFYAQKKINPHFFKWVKNNLFSVNFSVLDLKNHIKTIHFKCKLEKIEAKGDLKRAH